MTARNLKPWKPGQSGNPSGKPRTPEALRSIASLSQIEVCKLVSKYARMDPAAVDALIAARSIPMIELAIAQIFAQSAKRGDFQRLAFLLDRSIGKIPVLQPTNEDEAARQELAELSDVELLRLVKDKIPTLEKA